MNIITATAAKNISTDFANNAIGVTIKDIMDNIFYQAMRGERKFKVLIPIGKMSRDVWKSVIVFFQGLGYEVTNDYAHEGFWNFTLNW